MFRILAQDRTGAQFVASEHEDRAEARKWLRVLRAEFSTYDFTLVKVA